MKRATRPYGVLLAIISLLVMGCLLPGGVLAQSRQRLQRQLEQTRSRAAQAREELQDKQADFQRARNRLVEAQEELAAAEARLSRAKRQLARTRRELEQVRRNLERTRQRLAAHQDAMETRLLAAFRSKEPSYTEVLLRSTSFQDFATRAEFSRRIAQRDEAVLIRIVDDKMTIEEQQQLLVRKEAELEALKARVARERAVVAQKAEEARILARKAQEDVEEAQRQLAAMEAEARSIAAMLKRLAMAASHSSGGGSARYYGSWSGTFARPVPGPISSGFGMRLHPITHTMRFHDGVDISCPGGTPIGAAADGTVVSTGWRGPYGLTVIVDHGGGIATMYAHCERGSIQVSPGQSVRRGQTLARVDSTGWSTGDHLHWTVFRNGEPVNPFSM